MDFKKRITEELKLSNFQAEILFDEYINICEKLAKEYHREQSRIGCVIGSFPTEEQIYDKVSRIAASTWGDYGDGYIDGTINGAYWVMDFVNGEDK